MTNKIPSYLLADELQLSLFKKSKCAKFSFLDNTIKHSANAVKSIYVQAENAARKNFIYEINPHIKLISLLFLVIIISITNNVVGQFLITAFIFLLYILADLRIFKIYKKIFFLAFVFGFLVVMPASLNIISPGKIIFNLITFAKPANFWIYHIPQNIGFTKEGIHVVTIVFTRVLNSISFALLIVFTTSFPGFIKSFKIIGVPDTFQMIIMLAYKYIFILSQTIEETYIALKSRVISNINNEKLRKLISGRVLYIFKRSRTNYENIYYAMVSRGYSGKIHLHTKTQIRFSDILALLIVLVFGIAILFI